MSDVESNVLEHEAEFRALIDGFSFTLPGHQQSLGRDLAVAAATGIVERTAVDQKASDGSPLKANAPAYAARKRAKHDVASVGVLTGQMLSLQSVLGTPAISEDEVVMAYGTGTAATRFATRGDIRPDEPVDTKKAEWFTEGGRPFFELDESIAAELYRIAGEALDRYLGGAR